MSLADVYYVTVSISALAATTAFILSVVRESRERRRAAIQNWQRAVIQQIFQTVPEALSFEEIAQKYRNEAVGYRLYNLRGDDLSPQSLRLILVRMISDQILEQKGQDCYSLNSPVSKLAEYRKTIEEQYTKQAESALAMSDKSMHAIMAAMKDNMREHVTFLSRISNEIFNIVGDEPFKYSTADLSIKASQKLNVAIEMIRGHIVGMIARKELQADERGRVGIGPGREQPLFIDVEEGEPG